MTASESLTITVSTDVAAAVTPATSYATFDMSVPELRSSKKLAGNRTSRANISARKSSTTRFDTHAEQ